MKREGDINRARFLRKGEGGDPKDRQGLDL